MTRILVAFFTMLIITSIASAEITDGYTFGKKIHMNGGNNFGKPYHGFILNIQEQEEDLLVLSGRFSQVISIYTKKAEGGDIDAMHNLGLMYVKGLGVSKNLPLGIRYLEMSSEKRRWDADSVPLEKAMKELRRSGGKPDNFDTNIHSSYPTEERQEPTTNTAPTQNYTGNDLDAPRRDRSPACDKYPDLC